MKKIIIAVCIIAVLAVIGIYWIFPNAAFYLKIRKMKQYPFNYVVPKGPVKYCVDNIEEEKLEEITFLEYSLKLPIGDLKSCNYIGTAGGVSIEFNNFNFFYLTWSPNKLTRSFKKAAEGNRIMLSLKLANDYVFRKQALQTTPDDYSFFSPPHKNARVLILLICKAIGIAGDTENGCVEFETSNSIKGFQWGVSKKSESLGFEIYDKKNKHFDLVFSESKSLSNKKIETIIATIKRVKCDGSKMYKLALKHLQRKDKASLKKAKLYAALALTSRPKNPDYAIALLNACIKLKDKEQIHRISKHFKELHPKNKEIKRLLKLLKTSLE